MLSHEIINYYMASRLLHARLGLSYIYQMIWIAIVYPQLYKTLP